MCSTFNEVRIFFCVQPDYHKQNTGPGTKIVMLLVLNIIIVHCCFDPAFSELELCDFTT